MKCGTATAYPCCLVHRQSAACCPNPDAFTMSSSGCWQAAVDEIKEAQAASEKLPKALAADLYTASSCVAGTVLSVEKVTMRTVQTQNCKSQVHACLWKIVCEWQWSCTSS